VAALLGENGADDNGDKGRLGGWRPNGPELLPRER